MRIRSRNRKDEAAKEATHVAAGAPGLHNREISQRQFLKMMGTATGIAALAGAGQLVTAPPWAQAASGPPMLYNVRDYGAKGDGVTNDSAPVAVAINEAAQAGGGVVYFPAGTYLVSFLPPISRPVSLWGAGTDLTNMINQSQNVPAVSRLLWIGGTTTMLTIQRTAGLSIQNLVLDGNNVATVGVVWDTVLNCVLQNVHVGRCTTNCLRMQTYSSVLDDVGNAWNRFIGLALTDARTPLYVTDHNAATGVNTCHNTFVNLSVLFNDGPGVYLGDCDNNGFYDTYIYRNSGTGYGVEFSRLGRSNYFCHLQASTGGLVARSPSYNTIFAYDRDNLEPSPIVEPGARLTWYEEGGGSDKAALYMRPVTWHNPSNGVPNATDYERLAIRWDANVANIQMQYGGVHTPRELAIANDSGPIAFQTGGLSRWGVSPGGQFLPQADDAYDLGDSQHQVRDLYLAGAINLAGVPASPMVQMGEVIADGATNTLTFSGIRGGYSALVLNIVGRSTRAADTEYCLLTFNQDRGANYHGQVLDASGTTGVSGGASTLDAHEANSIALGLIPGSNAPAGVPALIDAVVYRYADTNWHKMLLARSLAVWGTVSGKMGCRSGGAMWRSTRAISRIDLTLSAGNWVANSAATLYGIP